MIMNLMEVSHRSLILYSHIKKEMSALHASIQFSKIPIMWSGHMPIEKCSVWNVQICWHRRFNFMKCFAISVSTPNIKKSANEHGIRYMQRWDAHLEAFLNSPLALIISTETKKIILTFRFNYFIDFTPQFHQKICNLRCIDKCHTDADNRESWNCYEIFIWLTD